MQLDKEYQTAGPAVLCAFSEVFVFWGLVTSCALVVFGTASSSATSGIISKAPWEVEAGAFLLVPLALLLELRSFHYVVAPQFNSYGPFELFGYQSIFLPWLVIRGLLSSFMKASVVCNVLVLACVLKTLSENQDVEATPSLAQLWVEAVRESLVSWVPGAEDLRIKS